MRKPTSTACSRRGTSRAAFASPGKPSASTSITGSILCSYAVASEELPRLSDSCEDLVDEELSVCLVGAAFVDQSNKLLVGPPFCWWNLPKCRSFVGSMEYFLRLPLQSFLPFSQLVNNPGRKNALGNDLIQEGESRLDLFSCLPTIVSTYIELLNSSRMSLPMPCGPHHPRNTRQRPAARLRYAEEDLSEF